MEPILAELASDNRGRLGASRDSLSQLRKLRFSLGRGKGRGKIREFLNAELGGEDLGGSGGLCQGVEWITQADQNLEAISNPPAPRFLAE